MEGESPSDLAKGRVMKQMCCYSVCGDRAAMVSEKNGGTEPGGANLAFGSFDRTQQECSCSLGTGACYFRGVETSGAENESAPVKECAWQ